MTPSMSAANGAVANCENTKVAAIRQMLKRKGFMSVRGSENSDLKIAFARFGALMTRFAGLDLHRLDLVADFVEPMLKFRGLHYHADLAALADDMSLAGLFQFRTSSEFLKPHFGQAISTVSSSNIFKPHGCHSDTPMIAETQNHITPGGPESRGGAVLRDRAVTSHREPTS